MHQLINKYIERTITPEEKEELNKLVQKDVSVREDFAYIQNIYALSGLFPADGDEKEGINKLHQFKKLRKKKKILPVLSTITKYAAIVCLTIVSTWIFMNLPQKKSDLVITYEEFKTPPGQRAILKLHDGTTVWLNAASTLRYPNVFSNNVRNVELDGEAFFDVKHNEKAPFIVSTEKLNIEVLGTSFNIFAYRGKNEFSTYLERGSVKIYSTKDKTNSLVLSPNEVVELKDDVLRKRVLKNKDFLLWKEGIYAFDNLPFKEIVKKLELYYDITIEINNTDLAEYPFNGKFRQRDGIVSALKTFQKAYPFKFYKDDELNHITIK